MNNKQFAKVLRVAMEYYDPSEEFVRGKKAKYMCHAINRAFKSCKLSDWQCSNAKKKIMKIVYPYETLKVRLSSKLGRPPTSEELLSFWDQYL